MRTAIEMLSGGAFYNAPSLANTATCRHQNILLTRLKLLALKLPKNACTGCPAPSSG